jgi:hypothetical protein
MPKVVLITATRLLRAEFAQCPLGLSLRRMGFDRTLRLALIEGNQRGLPAAYN